MNSEIPNKIEESNSVCLICDSDDLLSLFEFDSVCGSCGLVVDTAEKNSTPELFAGFSITVGGENDIPATWSDYATPTNSSEEQLVATLEMLEDLASELSLPVDVRQGTAELVRIGAKNRVFRGRSAEAVIAVLLYFGARECEIAVPLSCIGERTSCTTRNLETLARALRIELDLEHGGRYPTDYLPYLSRELECTSQVETAARDVLEKAIDRGLTNGKQPVGFAAAALYCLDTNHQSQRTVSRIAGISKETLRVRIRDLKETELVPY